MPPDIKHLLNAGSGPDTARRIARMVDEQGWKEVRFDIDPGVKPDVVGSILDIERSFEPQSFDVIWSSHVLEHLYAHEIFPTLCQFHRVLKSDGFALIMSPEMPLLSFTSASMRSQQSLTTWSFFVASVSASTNEGIGNLPLGGYGASSMESRKRGPANR